MVNANENVDEINIERIQKRLKYLNAVYKNTTNQKKKD